MKTCPFAPYTLSAVKGFTAPATAQDALAAAILNQCWQQSGMTIQINPASELGDYC